jgi:hypothetical protein
MPTKIQQFGLVNIVCSLAWQTLQSGKKIPAAQADEVRVAMMARVHAAITAGERSQARLLAIALETCDPTNRR